MHTSETAPIPWDEMQLFLEIVEGKSLTAAARRLRITQPTASRRLLQLEALLGERLFDRSVEGVTPTAFAKRMLEPVRRMAECAGELERSAATTTTTRTAAETPRGVVRITAPPGIAFEFVAPFAAWLRGDTKLPRVSLEVVSTVQFVDLARREADLALRMGVSGSGNATQKELVVLASFEHTVGAFASASYAKKLAKRTRKSSGGGTSPSLADVDWIGWAPPLDHISPNPELAKLIPGFRPVFSSDDFLVQLRAAEAGIGAIFLGRGRHRFSTSTLIELPVNVGKLSRTLHLVCAKSSLDIPRVRAVADFLVTELQFVNGAGGRRHPSG